MTKFRIKVESDLLDLYHVRTTLKAGEKEVKAAIVQFQLKQLASPENIKDIVDLIKEYVKSFVKPEKDEVVILSGRGPIWMYMALQHELQHIVGALAVFDPKIDGAFVTSVHNYLIDVNQYAVIEIPKELKEELTQ